MPYNEPLPTFIELAPFAKEREFYLDDEEYQSLQVFLAENPEAGRVIPHSGGCRKMRWNEEGKGKRGGLRIIYFLRLADGRIVLVTLYGKSAQANIDPRLLKAIRERYQP